jgi:hypothetical protein
MGLLKDRLTGTWALVSLETRRSDGTTFYLLGPNPRGRFMFDANGNFAAQLANPNRTEESAGYIANWGTYQVDEEQQTFTLHFADGVQLATVGQSTVRHVRFKDGSDRVAVFNTDPRVTDDVEEQSFITWEKIS